MATAAERMRKTRERRLAKGQCPYCGAKRRGMDVAAELEEIGREVLKRVAPKPRVIEVQPVMNEQMRKFIESGGKKGA